MLNGEQGATGPSPGPAPQPGGATTAGGRGGDAAQPLGRRRTEPSLPAPAPHSGGTALLLAPGQAPQPALRGLVPAPLPGCSAPTSPCNFLHSPRGGKGGRREGGGPTGRAAYPEAGPAESLHGRSRGAEPRPRPTPGTRGGGKKPGSFPPGRDGGGEERARRGPSRPPRRRREAPAPPPRCTRPLRPGGAGQSRVAPARPPQAAGWPPESPRAPLSRRGDPRRHCGSHPKAEHPRLVSQGGRGAATVR